MSILNTSQSYRNDIPIAYLWYVHENLGSRNFSYRKQIDNKKVRLSIMVLDLSLNLLFFAKRGNKNKFVGFVVGSMTNAPSKI